MSSRLHRLHIRTRPKLNPSPADTPCTRQHIRRLVTRPFARGCIPTRSVASSRCVSHSARAFERPCDRATCSGLCSLLLATRKRRCTPKLVVSMALSDPPTTTARRWPSSNRLLPRCSFRLSPQGRHGGSDSMQGSADESTARSARIGHARCSAVCHAAVQGFLEHLSCPLLSGGPHRPCLQQRLAPRTLRVRREPSLRAVKLQARFACVAWQSCFVLSRRRGQRDSTGL